jgi:hypothetical protein
MTLAALSLGLALAALPYPAPRQLQATNDTKCDTGAIVQVDAQRGEVRLSTRAGLVTYKVGAEVPVIGPDGKRAGSATALAAGTRVRVYYVLADGAKVQEIDLE